MTTIQGFHNLQGEQQAQDRHFQQIAAFSKTAVEVFGRILEEREKQKRLAAMDVLARTGATYNDMLAFQKLDDKLTREEFAAQDAVQKVMDQTVTLILSMVSMKSTKQKHKALD